MRRFGATAAPPLCTALLLLVSLLGALNAQAQSAASGQSARELYEQGTQALNAGLFDQAAQQLDASYRKEAVPGTMYNLGLAYKGMGHPGKALQAFESYVKFADAKREARGIEAVRAEIDRMKSGYARFALKLTPAGATIAIDGQPANADDGELWVHTGKHKIAFRAGGFENYEQTLDATAGRFDLEVNLRPAGVPDQRAAELIAEGIAQQSAGNAIQAIESFRQAQALYPTPKGAGLAGLAEEQVGDAGEAEAHLDSSLASRKDKWVRQNRAKMMAAKRRLKRILSTIDVQGEPAGALVSINEKPIGALPIGKVRVAGGSLLIRAAKDGYTDFEQTIELPVRAERIVLISMSLAPTPVLPPPIPVVVAPPPEPAPAIEPIPVAPPPPPEQRSSKSDFEAQSEPPPPPPVRHDSATGFEMAINFGYQPFIGGPKMDGATGLISQQILLGARILWPLSFGVQINGGFNLSTPGTKAVFALNPGVYVRGHLQREKQPLGFDAWAGVGLQPVAMQFSLLEAQPIDPAMVDITALDAASQSDFVKGKLGLDRVHTIQSINLPFELGASFYITQGFGLNLSLGLTLWLPQQDCLHDESDKRCTDSNLSSQQSFSVGGGLTFLL